MLAIEPRRPAAVTELSIAVGEIGAGEALGGGTLAVGAGKLLASEFNELQAIATKFDTTSDVVGSRAAGAGKNIEKLDMPVGKGMRSDIDVRIDGQVDIDSGGAFSDAPQGSM